MPEIGGRGWTTAKDNIMVSDAAGHGDRAGPPIWTARSGQLFWVATAQETGQFCAPQADGLAGMDWRVA